MYLVGCRFLICDYFIGNTKIAIKQFEEAKFPLLRDNEPDISNVTLR